MHNTTLRRRAGLLFSLLLLMACPQKDDSANDLLNSFQNSCSTWGAYSQGAKSQTQALVNVFENLKNRQDDACSRLNSTIQSIHQIASQAHGVFSDPEFAVYRQQQEELQELMLGLAKHTDPDVTEAIKFSLISTQVELAKSRASANSASSSRDRRMGYDDRYSVATRQLGEHFTFLYSQAGKLNECLKHNPSVALQLGMTLITAGGSFISPLIGAGVYIIGELFSITLEALRNQPMNDAIWKLHRAKMPAALTCGMDAIQTYYCQAEDSYKILRNHVKQYPSNNAPVEEFWKGLDILSRRLPVLNSWLLEVKSGVLPENPDESARINRVLEKMTNLDTRSNHVTGTLNQGIALSRRAESEETRRNYRTKYITEVAGYLSGNGSVVNASDPFAGFSSNSNAYACWLVLGYRAFGNCPRRGDLNETLSEYIENSLIPENPTVTLTEILQRFWPTVLEQVRATVDAEFSETIFIDPFSLMAKATEELTNGDSPIKTLRLIENFLRHFRGLSEESGKPQRLPLIDNTLDLVARAVQIIERNSLEQRIEAGETPLADIFRLFQLSNGTQFFGKRLSLIVEWDLQDRFKEGKLPVDVRDIVFTSGGEIRHRLLASGFDNIEDIAADLENARGLAQSNLRVFRKFYESSIARSVQELNELAQKEERGMVGPDRTHGQRLARLCTIVFSSADSWPDKVSWKICSAQTLYSVMPDSDNLLKIDVAALPNKVRSISDPVERRYAQRCAYHEFRRNSRIAEILRGRSRSLERLGLSKTQLNRALDVIETL